MRLHVVSSRAVIGLGCVMCGWYVEALPGELVPIPRRCPHCDSAFVTREPSWTPPWPPRMTRVAPHPTLDQIERNWC